MNVPFRKRRLTGVVLYSPSREQLPTRARCRAIVGIRDEYICTEEEVAAVERIAAQYRMSIATVAYLILPIPPKVGANDHSTFSRSYTTRTRRSDPAAQLLRRGSTIAIFRDYLQRIAAIRAVAESVIGRGRSMLLLVPHRAWFTPLQNALRDFSCVVLDRTVGRRDAWLRAVTARQPGTVIIGTRAAACFAPSSLGAIVLDHAESDDFKQRDAQPRYDARSITAEIATARGIPRLLLTAAPRTVDWAHADRRVILGTTNAAAAPEIIDLSAHWRGGGRGLLTPRCLECINESFSAHRVALVLHNRRNRAHWTTCADCAYTISCVTCRQPLVERDDSMHCGRCRATIPIPVACPSCGSARLIGRGLGTVAIAALLARVFPDAIVARVDSDDPSPPAANAAIVVASERFLSSFAPSYERPVGVTIVLDADRFVGGDDYRSEERLLLALSNAAAWAATWHCPCIVQTRNPQRPAVQALHGSLATFYHTELSERAALRYPPATRLIRCGIPTGVNGEAMTEVLQSLRLSGIIETFDGPFDAADGDQRRATTVIIRLCGDATDKQIATLIEQLPATWTIDTDPIALS